MGFEELISSLSEKNWQGKEFKLDRTRYLLQRLGDPQKQLKFIHVAGTNGKGSTSVMLASILQAAGLKTGLYTSPYIEVANERIQIDGQLISDKAAADLIAKLHDIVNEMPDRPTEFELLTALAMLYFKQNDCDIVVLEVGLGGRLDATNVIDTPEVAVITAIGLDHMKELGHTVEKIAKEKAGIIKTDSDVVFYQQQDSVREVIAATCRKKQARMYVVDFSSLKVVERTIHGQTLDFETFRQVFLPLLGDYQAKNAAVAIKTIEVLQKRGWPISEQHILTGLKQANWPGRFEVLHEAPLFMVDGAHNPNGVKALTQSLDEYFAGQKVTIIMGVLADKDYQSMVDLILPYAKKMILLHPDSERALAPADLRQVIITKGFTNVVGGKNLETVVAQVLEGPKAEVTLAMGSLYMIGEIKKIVRLRR